MRFAVFVVAAAASLVFPPLHAADPPEKILVITSEVLKPAFEEYAAWKIRLGTTTEVVSIDEIKRAIPAQDPEPDIQEKIRRFIIEKIDTENVHWVVLGGDSEPERLGVRPAGSFECPLEKSVQHLVRDRFVLESSNAASSSQHVREFHRVLHRALQQTGTRLDARTNSRAR